jgi:acetyltransferase-like isoleucine patch superfamily enzyme
MIEPVERVDEDVPPGGLASAAARGFDRLLPAYWPVRRFLWRCRWLLLRVRTEVGARAVGSRVRFEIDPGARIGRRVAIEVLPGTQSQVRVAARSWIADDCFFQLSGGTLTVGEGAMLRSGMRATVGGELRLGARCVIGWYVALHCAEQLVIDEDAGVAERSTVSDSIHARTEPGVPMFHHVESKPVHLGANCNIGAGSVVGPGVTIGEGAVVSANSVVVRDVPAFWFASGSPARAIKDPRRT